MASDLHKDEDKEFTLWDIFKILILYPKTIVIAALICASAGYALAEITPKTYESTVLISPATERAGSGRLSGLGSLASEVGGLGSLVGLGAGSSSYKNVAIATLKSDLLTSKYIEDNDLLPILFKKYWNAETKSWIVSEPSKLPTVWKANQMFKKSIRTVSEDTKTGLVTVTIRWRDAQLAAQWANGLVNLANNYLRKKAIDDSERNIGYLREEISKTNVVPLQQALYSLMENEIKEEMLARGTEQYALKVIDFAVSPEKPMSPLPTVWTILGFILGISGASILILIRTALKYKH